MLDLQQAVMGMGPAEAKLAYDQLLVERARYSLEAYNEAVYGWQAARHHKIWIEEIEKKENKILVFIAPPGSAKTNVCGVGMCGWEIGRDVNTRVGYICNMPKQSHKQSVAIRETILRSAAYGRIFPKVEPDYDMGWGEAEWFLKRTIVSKDPTMFACGVEGDGIQGYRFNRQVWDDVCDVSNMATAAAREKLLYWLEQMALPRFEGVPDWRLIVPLTRYHSDDVVKLVKMLKGARIIHMPALGYWELVESKTPEQRLDEVRKEVEGVGLKFLPNGKKKKLRVESVAEATDGAVGEAKAWIVPTTEQVYEKRHELYEGGVLWPGVQDREKFLNIRERNRRVFEMTYQGFPFVPAGNIFKREWWGRFSLAEVNFGDVIGVMQSWDTAHTVSDSSDYSVGFTFLIMRTGHILVADRRKGKWEQPDLEVEVKSFYTGCWPRPNIVLMEDRGGGKTMCQVLQASVNPLIPIVPVRNTMKGDAKVPMETAKARQAASISGFVKMGRVLVPYDAPWVEDFLDNMTEFPGAKHDDDVDAFCQGVVYLVGGSIESINEILTSGQVTSGRLEDLREVNEDYMEVLSMGPETSEGEWIKMSLGGSSHFWEYCPSNVLFPREVLDIYEPWIGI